MDRNLWALGAVPPGVLLPRLGMTPFCRELVESRRETISAKRLLLSAYMAGSGFEILLRVATERAFAAPPFIPF